MRTLIINKSLKRTGLILGLLVIYVGALGCQVSCGTSEIPAASDLRDHNLLTPIKIQNGLKADGATDIGSTVGLCWAFSSLASLESNYLKQSITKSLTDNEANFSAWYLGNYIGYNEPEYQYNGETIPDTSPPTTFGYYSPATAGWGGVGAFWVADYLISGKELPPSGKMHRCLCRQ